MAWALVQNPAAANGGGTSINKAFASNVTAGNAIVAIATTDPNTTCTFSSTGDTWQTTNSFFNSVAGQMLFIGIATNVTGGAKTVTATFGATGIFNGLIIAEFSGGALSSPVDQTTPGRHNATSTTPTDASMTTTVDGDLIVSVVLLDSAGSTVTAGSGYTLLTQDTTDLMSAEFQVQGTAGSIAGTFNASVSAANATTSAAFIPAGGASSSNSPYKIDIPLPLLQELILEQQNRVQTGVFAVDQTINANSITTSEQLGTPSVSPVISANGISSSEIVASPTVTTTYTINANGITSSEFVGNSQVTTTYTVNAQSITSSEQLGSPIITQVTAINASGISSSERLGNAQVTTTYTINANGIPTSELFGNPNIATASSITAQGIPSSERVGQPAVTTSYTINAGGIPSSEVFGSTQVSQTIAAYGIATSERLGNPSLQVITAINAGSIASTEQVGNAQVIATYTINAQGIPTNERLGSPSVATASVISAGSITSSEQFGKPTITTGSVTVIANSIFSSERVGNPLVSIGIPGLNVQVHGIPSETRVGFPNVMNQPTNVIIWRKDPMLKWVADKAINVSTGIETIADVVTETVDAIASPDVIG